MRIVAVDPGKMSGCVSGKIRSNSFVCEKWSEFGLGELSALGAFVADGVGLSGKGRLGVLVIEDFVLYGGGRHVGGKASDGLSPVFVTGLLLGWLEGMFQERFLGLHIEYQMASAAKGVITDVRLRSLGGWIVGSAHCRDAYRHAELCARRISQNRVASL